MTKNVLDKSNIMKISGYIVLLVCMIFGIVNNSLSQDTIYKSKINYYVWIKNMSGKSSPKLVLYSTKDSSIIASSSFYITDYTKGRFKTSEYFANDIYKINVRKKGRILRGASIGFGVGFLIFGAIGYGAAQGLGSDQQNNYEAFAVFGVIGAGLGAGIGAGIGSIKVSIPINGNKDSFKSKRNELYQYGLIRY